MPKEKYRLEVALAKRQLSNDGEMLAYYYNTKREAADSDGFNYFPEIDPKIQIAPQLYTTAPIFVMSSIPSSNERLAAASRFSYLQHRNKYRFSTTKELFK